MPACPVVRIKSSHASQGEFVEINASDFDAEKHVLHVSAPPPPPVPVVEVPPAKVDPLDALAPNWRATLDADALSALAVVVSDGRTPENTEQAIAMIEAALAAKVAH